jgi:A/G-specific adenine glycosylase
MNFSDAVLQWFEHHGRKDLPWQQNPNPYRIWVSEIMLQQTQVSTVIPYFQRFMAAFPDVQSLAATDLDAVLHHWTGLGYYARARHLHRAAQTICIEHGGELPKDLTSLQALPGIGRSTAGAILAMAYGQRQAILDGNVKRVLCRYYAIRDWPGHNATQKRLWQLAEQHTPTRRVAEYTQAMMDLGATVCTRAPPGCVLCPLNAHCQALRQNCIAACPAPRPRKTLPLKQTRMLLLHAPDNTVLLQQRPPSGLWGGLYCLPELPPDHDVMTFCRDLRLAVKTQDSWPAFRHTFTHFHLDIQPIHLVLQEKPQTTLEKTLGANTLWYNASVSCGLAAPVVKLLARIF